MNDCNLNKFIETSQGIILEVLKIHENIETFNSFIGRPTLGSPGADNFKLCCILFALSSGHPGNRMLQARTPTRISQWGNCKHEGPKAAIARLCVKVTSMGNVVCSAAGSGEDWRNL